MQTLRLGWVVGSFMGVLSSAAVGCGGDTVDSDEQARRAYLGLDPSIGESITLGFAGFNSANSANIAPQTSNGIEHGTLTITGQVDQGASNNKGMRLAVGMVMYDDGPFVVDTNNTKIDVVYATDDAAKPALDMMLRNIPTGTLDGTLMGVYHLTGDLKGDVTLNLTFTANLADAGGGKVTRAAGTTHITGTAVQGDGTYDVDVTL
jgi:hypothetical protein